MYLTAVNNKHQNAAVVALSDRGARVQPARFHAHGRAVGDQDRAEGNTAPHAYGKRFRGSIPAHNQQAVLREAGNTVAAMTFTDDLSVNDRDAVRIIAVAAAMLIQEGAGIDAAKRVVGDTLLRQRIGRSAPADKHTLRVQNLDHIPHVSVAGDILKDNAVSVLVHIAVAIEHIAVAARRRDDLFRLDGHKARVENGLRLLIAQRLQLVHLILRQENIGDPAKTPRLKHCVCKRLSKIRRGSFQQDIFKAKTTNTDNNDRSHDKTKDPVDHAHGVPALESSAPLCRSTILFLRRRLFDFVLFLLHSSTFESYFPGHSEGHR